jgi:PIN domain nuclease of toxin-antitoxin system
MILLDTAVLLWLAMDPERLSDAARRALDAPAERVWVSAISGFEVGQKHARGKLELPMSPEVWVSRALAAHALEEIPISLAIALRATALPRLHDDPFDRLLIATAQTNRLTLLTPDRKIMQYPDLETLW